MACLFGGYLARSGVKVTLAGSWPAGLAALKSRGITVSDGVTAWSTPVQSAPIDQVAGRFGLVLVLVKSYQTRTVAPWLRRTVADEGLVVTLQNGLGNEPILARAVGRRRLAVGATAMGATLIAPAQVRVGGTGPTVVGSRLAAAEPLQRLAACFTAAGLETTIGTDIDQVIWRKLAVNCAINAKAALSGVPNGRLLEDPATRQSMVRAASEVGAVAQALGIDLGVDPAAAALETAERTAGNLCSMLQDLQRGARTEIDALNGAVVRLGRRHGVPTSENERLWRAIRSVEGRPRTGRRRRHERAVERWR